MNAIGASILIVLIAVVFWAPRRWALVGMMAGVLYLTQTQMLNLFGLHLFAIRLLELVGFTRILLRKEFSFSKLNEIDRVFLWLYAYTTLVFLIRSKTDQANHIAMMAEALFSYFTFRALIISSDDLKWFLGVFGILLFPYVTLVLVEMLTHNNPFAVIGGLNFVERGGRLRCMATFRHPSLLGGALGASFLPVYIGLVFVENFRLRAFFGMALCLGIVILSNSGGPLSAAALGLIGWLCWIIRTKMSLVRRSLACFIIAMGFIMKAPIWYLLAKVSSISGGDGWHRSYLMDIAFRNFDQWWLSGMDLKLTSNWFEYTLEATGTADITNQYLAFGLDAGLLSMVLFIFLLVRAFQAIGQASDYVSSIVKRPNDVEYLLWGLGCALLVHISTWMGITYTFDQSGVIWFMQLAAISSILQECAISSEGIEDEQQPTVKNVIRYSIYKAKI